MFVFPIDPHLEEKTLEGLSIIVCLRWMIYVIATFIVAILASIIASKLAPDLADSLGLQGSLFIWIGLTLALMGRDIWLVRRRVLQWDEQRIRSQSVMKRLPLLLLILVPVFLVSNHLEDPNAALTWASDMLWMFSFLSVLFYIVYFILLFSIPKRPNFSALSGFVLAILGAIWGGISIKERKDEEKKREWEATSTSPEWDRDRGGAG